MPDIVGSAERREQQRIKHLVLEKPRPRSDRAARRRKSVRAGVVVLEPGIEEIVDQRERWSHKQGTPQTHDHAARYREGSLARLYQSGAIDADQLAASIDIAGVIERIGADVAVKTASLETRIDSNRHGDGGFHEALHLVRHELAYTRWRAALRGPVAPVLEMIAGDMPLTAVARIYRMHNRRARQLLIDALDLWPAMLGAALREVDEATLAAAQAGILG